MKAFRAFRIPIAAAGFAIPALGISSCADSKVSGREAESWTGSLARQEGNTQTALSTGSLSSPGTSGDSTTGTGSGTDP